MCIIFTQKYMLGVFCMEFAFFFISNKKQNNNNKKMQIMSNKVASVVHKW